MLRSGVVVARSIFLALRSGIVPGSILLMLKGGIVPGRVSLFLRNVPGSISLVLRSASVRIVSLVGRTCGRHGLRYRRWSYLEVNTLLHILKSITRSNILHYPDSNQKGLVEYHACAFLLDLPWALLSSVGKDRWTELQLVVESYEERGSMLRTDLG